MSERVVVVGAGAISNAWFPPLLAAKVELEAVVNQQHKAPPSQMFAGEQTGLRRPLNEIEIPLKLMNAINHIAGARLIRYFYPDGSAGTSFRDGFVVNFHRGDVGDKIRGVASNMNMLAHGNRIGKLDGGYADSVEIMGHLADGPFLCGSLLL